MTSSAISFGDTNVGFQAGNIHGPVTNTFHTLPERRETTPQPSIVIPFARDADFVNRGSLVDDLRERCALPNARIALVGLGGVGKSQIAIEHAYAARDRSSQTWVLWAHASSAARLEQSFRDIADRVKIAGRRDQHANIFKLVHDWLCDSKEQWLLVLDNLDDASFLLEAQGASSKAADRPLREYLPHCERGSILITTRNRGAALKLVDQRDIIALDPMSEAEAQTLLGRKLDGHVTQHDDGPIVDLAAALEYMPLAIVQAAAYISQRAPLFSVPQYLNQFKKSERKQTSLLNCNQSQLRRDREARNSIITTWQISFEYIQRTQPSATDLLSLMSFFDRQAIPKSVLQIRAEHEEGEVSREDGETEADCSDTNQSQSECKGGEFEDNYEDDSEHDYENDSADDSDAAFQNNVATLRNFSFISVNTDGTAFEMHALVQLSTRTWLIANGKLEQWKHEFISKLCTAFPTGEYENWAVCQTLFAHAKKAVGHKPEAASSLVQWATLLYCAASYAWRKGSAGDTETLAVHAMEAWMEVLGQDDEEIILSMDMVANAYSLRGRWEKAEEVQMQVVEKCKAKLGDDHTSTIRTVGNLASIYRKQGQWDKAKELQVQVVEKYKAELGDDHLDTLRGMHNLALTYWDQGQLDKGEELQVQVVEKYKAKLGDNHLSTLTSIGNLALMYSEQGRWEEAEKLFCKTLALREKLLTKDHPDTLKSMNNLALIYSKQRRWEGAEKLHRETLALREKVLPKDHPDTLISICQLAYILLQQHCYEDALPLYQRAYEGFESTLMLDHRSVLACVRYYAFVQKMVHDRASESVSSPSSGWFSRKLSSAFRSRSSRMRAFSPETSSTNSRPSTPAMQSAAPPTLRTTTSTTRANT